MSLIYVTGISGSGKSTVRSELRARDYEAYDVDEDGFKSWYNTDTGAVSTDQRAWKDTDVEWRRMYQLKIARPKVARLADVALQAVKPTFVCGTTPNDGDVWDLFDRVIHLSVSNETLRQRLAARVNNDYGKHPEELQDILGWNVDAAERNHAHGAILANGERPVEEVVDEILQHVELRP